MLKDRKGAPQARVFGAMAPHLQRWFFIIWDASHVSLTQKIDRGNTAADIHRITVTFEARS